MILAGKSDSGEPGTGYMAGTTDYARMLIRHYNNLIELYKRFEILSSDILDALGDSSRLGIIQEKLREKMTIVEDIQKESQKIANLKVKIKFSEKEKTEVRKVEDMLTAVVNRVVEQEDRSRDILLKQGLKISRK